ncbi:MAG: tripartite tricarboxylate transporter substrate binding protein [Comamonadaceae bacterium]|nr:tripartite tricarboxylate transporter substrate binding protein [Burkholderiales bacterium]MEB2349214.1 tripartite tricarboxylate transporter substrate binding protein [Comamonadaceae bacterium]
MTRWSKYLTLLAGLLLAGGALAQSTKTVSLMVPYPAGGPSDAIARGFNMPLGQALGQQVIVENLGGATGAIAAQKVLSAPADGRYLFQGSPNEAILAPLVNAAVKFKTEDFRLVHPITNNDMVIVARKDFPANNVDELLALARKSPDKPLSYGSVGVGSLYHLIVEDIQHRKGVKFTHVPYKGNAPLLQDMGGGSVDFAVLVYSAGMGAMVDEGRLKLLGQLSAKRSPQLQNVPSLAEGQELAGFDMHTWAGIMVPRSTPEAVVQHLHGAIQTALQDPQVRTAFEAQSGRVAAPMSQKEADDYYVAETARYRAIAKSINLQPQ